ncbi:MAG: ATP-binding protein [Verrucomicrobiota bacterium]|nr:ATP-binding protein [Verrucomicrobiota bacterium]
MKHPLPQHTEDLPTLPAKILVVDDSQAVYEQITQQLRNSGFACEVSLSPSSTDALQLGSGSLQNCDLVITRDKLPELNALTVLSSLRTGGHTIPVIVLSGGIGEARAVELMGEGACDCIHIDNLNRLTPAIRRHLHEATICKQHRKDYETARLLELACRMSGRPIVVADACRPDNPIIFVNKEFEDLSGYSAAEVLGWNCRILQGNDHDQKELKGVREALSRGHACQATVRNYRKDGTMFYNHFKIRPLHDASGKVTHFVGVQSDVTELKQLEERSRLALQHEQEMNHIKSQFVTMVSHEFRTPLGVINTAAHMLGRYLDRMSSEERTAKIQEIQNSVDRMTEMMDDLLLFGRIEAQKMECTPVRLDLRRLCNQSIADVAHYSSVSRVIVCTVAPDAAIAFLDEKLLRHILSNLLSNAVKYSSPDKPITLEIKRMVGHPLENTKLPQQDHLEIKVIDCGIGIPAADIPRLFQTFHRASNVGNRAGTGIGLAIVKQCVELHGGTIHVESTEGHGTTFWVCLPFAPLDTIEQANRLEDSL